MQGRLPQDKGDISYVVNGESALTKYRVLEERRNFSIIEVMPFTGRRNQIRIHFKQIGHPIVGETKYAFRRDFKLRAKRLCLHAQGLEFTHPVTQKKLHLRVELPQDMKYFLENHE